MTHLLRSELASNWLEPATATKWQTIYDLGANHETENKDVACDAAGGDTTMRSLYYSFALGVLLLLANSARGNWDIPVDKSDLHVYLLMGQSNMAGTETGPSVLGDTDEVPFILELRGELNNETTGTQKWDSTEWEPAAHPLHETSLGGSEFGLGMDFAKTYLQNNPGVTVGLIPIARGGGDISGNHDRNTVRYANAVERARYAMDAGVIKGVLWQQGEADTSSWGDRIQPDQADAYAGRLDQLVRDLRADLDSPYLAFSCGQFSPGFVPTPDYNVQRDIDTVKAALANLPNRMARTGFFDTTGVANVGTHYNRAGLIVLGQRHADAMRDIESDGVVGIAVPNFSFEGEGVPGVLNATQLNQGGLQGWSPIDLASHVACVGLRDLNDINDGEITSGSGGQFSLVVESDVTGAQGVVSVSNPSVFAVGYTYTLTVAVGRRKTDDNLSLPASHWGIALWDATDNCELKKLEGAVAQGGALTDQVLEYAAELATDGHDIQIRLLNPASSSTNSVVFDDVRLTSSAASDTGKLGTLMYGR